MPFPNAIHDYDESNLRNLLLTFSEITGMLKAASLDRELAIIQRYITCDKFIDVVVLGQFKAGKSSFINSLLGTNLLPIGVIPVTSIITRIQYGQQNTAFVEFKDSAREEIRIENINRFITEELNPSNEKKVALVDVYTNNLTPFPNLRIVDTPGIGSFNKQNSEVTQNWYPEIGLALVAISAERPFAEEDFNLLNEIKRHSAGVYIILTKTDLYNENQLNQLKEYVQKSLINSNLNNYEIIPYSTYKKTEEMQHNVIEKILVPLNKDFESNYRRIWDHKIKALGESCISYLQVGMKVCKKNEKDKQQLANIIIDEQLKFTFIEKQLNILTETLKAKNREIITEILMPFLPYVQNNILNEFEIDFDSWNLNLYKLSREFESWIEGKLKEQLMMCFEQAALSLGKYLENLLQHYSLLISSFKERLQQNIRNSLGIELTPTVLKIENARIKHPDISVSYSFDIQLDLIWFVFPMSIFKTHV